MADLKFSQFHAVFGKFFKIVCWRSLLSELMLKKTLRHSEETKLEGRENLMLVPVSMFNIASVVTQTERVTTVPDAWVE